MFYIALRIHCISSTDILYFYKSKREIKAITELVSCATITNDNEGSLLALKINMIHYQMLY